MSQKRKIDWKRLLGIAFFIAIGDSILLGLALFGLFLLKLISGKALAYALIPLGIFSVFALFICGAGLLIFGVKSLRDGDHYE